MGQIDPKALAIREHKLHHLSIRSRYSVNLDLETRKVSRAVPADAASLLRDLLVVVRNKLLSPKARVTRVELSGSIALTKKFRNAKREGRAAGT